MDSNMLPSTSDRQTGKGASEKSWTESEREERTRLDQGTDRVWTELKTHLDEGEELAENQLPEKAAQVFSPTPSSPWDATETLPFMSPLKTSHDYNQHGRQNDWTEDTPPTKCGRACPSRDVLKVGVSLMTSALIFPVLVWGGFVFLPFDAPLLGDAPSRLVYTLRCSIFASTPIVLGWLVLGVTRLRAGTLQPLFDKEVKEAELYDVTVHRRFISDSTSLFLLYFLQLVVMAMYLDQEQLKLVPLLTVVFAFGRLAYWVAAAFGSSVRGFGFGLCFLPSVAMTIANIYFIFTVEASGSIFSVRAPPEEVLTPPAGRQRFWG